MLLAFEVEGYKLFDERIEFTMHANMRFKKLKENIYTKTIKNRDIHALKSAIIYGPNNSGKTTFIKAVSVLKGIIEKECIDDVCNDSLNFNFFGENKTIDFFIEFLSEDHHYEFKLDVAYLVA